jgi:hypothetical protein
MPPTSYQQLLTPLDMRDHWTLKEPVKAGRADCTMADRCLRALGRVILVFAATVAVGAREAAFPLQVAESRRFLVDAHDRPFLVQAEAAWSLVIGLTREEVELYLRDRRERGFNALIANLIEREFAGAANSHGAPRNRSGEGPFTTPGDFSTPNEAYFGHADWALARAEAEGFVVFLAPCYLGYPRLTEGWYDEVLKNGVARCREYGRFVGYALSRAQEPHLGDVGRPQSRRGAPDGRGDGRGDPRGGGDAVDDGALPAGGIAAADLS